MTKIGKILYIYDALCGWCYGFSNIINDIKEEYQEKFDFEILSGGMITGERVGKIGEKFDYIKSAYKQVEDHTGCKFGPSFLKELEKGELVLSSIEPSKALSVIKENSPENAFSYASDLQNAIYFDGKDVKQIEILANMAEKYMTKDDFVDKYQSSEIESATNKEFNFVSALGINGFPSVLLEKDEKYYILARGFQYKMDLQNMFKQIIRSDQQESAND